MASSPLGFLNSAPNPPPQVALDPGAQSLLNSGAQLAGASPSDYQSRDTQGMSEYANSLNGAKSAQQESAGTGEDPYNNEAIRRAYASQTGRNIDQLKQQNSLGVQQQRANVMAQYARAALGQQQAATQQYSFLTQAYDQQEQQRAQFISSIFQTGDTAMGMYYGGRRSRTPSPGAAGNEVA